MPSLHWIPRANLLSVAKQYQGASAGVDVHLPQMIVCSPISAPMERALPASENPAQPLRHRPGFTSRAENVQCGNVGPLALTVTDGVSYSAPPLARANMPRS